MVGTDWQGICCTPEIPISIKWKITYITSIFVSTELTTVHHFHPLPSSPAPLFVPTFVSRQDSQTESHSKLFKRKERVFLIIRHGLSPSLSSNYCSNFLLCAVWQPRSDGIHPWWNFNFYDGAFLLAIYQRSQLPATPFKYEGGNCAPSLVFPRYTAED